MRLHRFRFLPALALLLALPTSGCATLGYYAQALSGQLEILARARPIEALLDDPELPPQRRERLARALAAREFAIHALGLPDNGSYRRFADLQRPYVAWNVFAAPELSLAPKQWCYAVVGCVAYRGFFARERAERYAAALRAQGYDTYVGGVAAFSTLGYFRDPLLNTILDRPEVEMAGVLFHELAHQRLYVRDDSTFSESFAVAVEIEGLRRWLAHNGDAEAFAGYLETRRRRDEFITLMLEHRTRLEAVYASDSDDATKRAAKQVKLAALRRAYAELKQRWGGYDGFDAWVEQDLNNAKLAAVGTYHRHVPAFQALLTRHDGELAAFYRAAEELARLPRAQRDAALAALAEEGDGIYLPARLRQRESLDAGSTVR